MMTKKELKDLIKEREHVEFKTSLSLINEIIQAISAFANTEGGKIIVGVDDSGKVLGVEIGKGTIENLANTIGQNTEPKIQPIIKVETIGEKKVIIIEVKESLDKLVLAFGRPFKRVGKSSPKMSKDEYERLILEKHKERLQFDKDICKKAKLKDIDAHKLKSFLIEARSKRRIGIKINDSTKDALMRLKLMEANRLTNAAILLFGKDPQRFFEQTEIKCIRFKGINVTGEMIDLKLINGDIINQVKEIEKFIYDHIQLHSWIESGEMKRQEKWEYPPKAIREALANALAHRDYHSVSKVQVRIFDDRIEFWNPGRLPEGWTTENLKRKHESKPFNFLISKMFFWIKYVEEVGTGTNKIIQWCREWDLPEPDFEFTGTAIVLTIRRTKLREEYLQDMALSEEEYKIIEYIDKHKKIKSRDIQKMFDVTRDTANRYLKKLISLKLVKREGIGKAIYYILQNR